MLSGNKFYITNALEFVAQKSYLPHLQDSLSIYHTHGSECSDIIQGSSDTVTSNSESVPSRTL